MTLWSEIFLGVIAVATLMTAIVQIGVLIAAGLAVRRVGRLLDRVEHELKPAFAQFNTISREAARAVSLVTAQVERADKLFTDFAERVETTVSTVQNQILGPAREGKAFITALRTALDVIREARRHARARTRSEDEDALFI